MNDPINRNSYTKKIKVLRIIARLNIGGPAIHTILLTHYLDTDIETKLVVGEISKGEESMDYLLKQYNIKPLYINTLKREISFVADLSSVLYIYKIIKKFKPDIVHTHTAKAGTVGRSAAILYNLLHFKHGKKRIRLVHTFHGHVFRGYFNRALTLVFIWIERIAAIFTDRIIAVSDALKDELVNKYKIASDKKIRVIYNGYELDPFLRINEPQNVTGAKDRTSAKETVVAAVGRLIPIKGHKFLISGFNKLKIRARLVIAGDGILRNELEELTKKLGLSEKVEFIGYKKNIVPVYEDIDIFVLTSLNEGAPSAVIEALAAAKPVIATDVGGVSDLLGGKITSLKKDVYLCERGILIPPSDDEAVAAAIRYLAANQETARQIGITGRRFVEKFFTVNRLANDMILFYRDVIEQ